MTLQQVFDFLAVAQHGSVHGAARATGQTQPALTKSIRRLEESLGAPLFERHAGGVRLSEAGRLFLVHAKRLAAEARQARESVAHWLGARLGRVEFGISAAPSLLLAPSAIQQFRAEYPNVELRSHGGLYHALAPLLRDGQVDFVICPLPSDPVDASFESRTLIDSQMTLVARRGHSLANARSLAEVRDARFVVGGARGQPGGGIHEAFERAGLPPPHIELHTNGLIESASMIVSSDCLAMIPAALMRSGLLRERLVMVPVEDALPDYTVSLLRRVDAPRSPAAASLAAWFEREAAYLRG